MLLSKPCKHLQQDFRCSRKGSHCDPHCIKMRYSDADEPDGPEEETLIQPLSEFIWAEKRVEPSGNSVSAFAGSFHEGISSGGIHGSRGFEERRKHPRFAIELPLEFKGEDGLPRGAVVRNISEGGLLICSIHDMPVGRELKVRVFFVDEYELDQFKATARIAWKDDHSDTDWEGYKYALEIVEISMEDRQKLVHLLMSPSILEEIPLKEDTEPRNLPQEKSSLTPLVSLDL